MGSRSADVILFAHGSNVPEANRNVAIVAEAVSRQSGLSVRCAFLELAQPDLARALEEAVRGGAQRVIIVPYFLTLGVHVREDLPRLVEEQRTRFPNTQILVAEPLEGHAALAAVVLDRIQAVIEPKETAFPKR